MISNDQTSFHQFIGLLSLCNIYIYIYVCVCVCCQYMCECDSVTDDSVVCRRLLNRAQLDAKSEEHYVSFLLSL